MHPNARKQFVGNDRFSHIVDTAAVKSFYDVLRVRQTRHENDRDIREFPELFDPAAGFESSIFGINASIKMRSGFTWPIKDSALAPLRTTRVVIPAFSRMSDSKLKVSGASSTAKKW